MSSCPADEDAQVVPQHIREALNEFGVPLPSCRRVLLVDDEQENLDVLVAVLEDDYQVFTAQTGEDALKVIAARGEMDLVIADQRMPGISGVELLARIAATDPATVRIVLTAYSDIGPMIDAVNRGSAYRFMMKPFEAAELRSVVRESLRIKTISAALAHLVDELSAHKAKLNATLRQLQDQQKQLLAAERLTTLGRTTSGIVHDLRNASAILHVLLDLVRRETQHEAVIQAAELAWANLGSLLELLEQIRDFARSNSTEPLLELTDIEDFLRSTLRLFYLEQGTARCPINMTVDLRHKNLRIDRSRMRQAVMALLRNAVQASDPGRDVALTALANGDATAYISVRDQGRGMDAETLDRAKRPFFSAFEPHGLGLGLEIVRLAAEAHGGTLVVQSQPGEGTHARISIPDAVAVEKA